MLAAQIHRHVPGGRNVFGAGFGDQLQFGQTVVIGDAADDLGGGQIIFINRLRLSEESGNCRFKVDPGTVGEIDRIE